MQEETSYVTLHLIPFKILQFYKSVKLDKEITF